MKTKENVMSAFAGESQANRKYLAFALKAEKEGFDNIARVFRAIAEGETIHALKLLSVAGKVGSTAENLAEALAGEKYEFNTMYPEFIATAKEEKQEEAQKIFEYANEAEKVHGKTFADLKETVTTGKDIEGQDVYLCPVCGWVGLGDAPERCPICKTPATKFKKF